MSTKVQNEVTLIAGAVVAVAQLVVGIVTNHLDVTVVTAAITAIGAIFTRSQVTPNSKL